MAHSLADWALNVASPIIKLRVRPPHTESILNDPAYSQNTVNRWFWATGVSCDSQSHLSNTPGVSDLSQKDGRL